MLGVCSPCCCFRHLFYPSWLCLSHIVLYRTWLSRLFYTVTGVYVIVLSCPDFSLSSCLALSLVLYLVSSVSSCFVLSCFRCLVMFRSCLFQVSRPVFFCLVSGVSSCVALACFRRLVLFSFYLVSGVSSILRCHVSGVSSCFILSCFRCFVLP